MQRLDDNLQATLPMGRIVVQHLPDCEDPGFQPIADIEAPTFPNLGEFDEYRTVRVFLYGAL